MKFAFLLSGRQTRVNKVVILFEGLGRPPASRNTYVRSTLKKRETQRRNDYGSALD